MIDMISPSAVAEELPALFDETVALFHRLRRAAQQVHGQGEATAGRRGILRSLEQGGPQTVPQLARARPVSRQHIQVLVNPLLAEGLVEALPNPSHRRSQLLRLTPRGRQLLERMEARERRLCAGLRVTVSRRQLQEAAEVLRRVRQALEAARPGGER
jgi:DNA-binding MarR family transcriptional regulator